MAEGHDASTETTRPDLPEERKLAVGDRVGRYELRGMLGEGGMSFVYLAHDPELDREVALKLMRVRVGPEGARRLHREAQALAKLSHPNVVPVYDAGMVGGQAFVAMEYVPGKTLRKWLKAPLTWRQIVAVMIDAGRGLAAAHARGLIHRDFKPDNVLIGDDGRVRVLDFGLARLAGMLDGSVPSSRESLPPDSVQPSVLPPAPSSGRELSGPEAFLTRADQLIGTPAYMAPEQLRREPIDERTDIYAFGVSFYEALFGVRPHATPRLELDSVGSSVKTVTTTIKDVGAPTVPPHANKKRVPRRIQRIVLRALAHDPARRWGSINAMLAALERDPFAPWRRAGIAAGVLSAGLLALGVARERASERALCHGGEVRMQSAWGPRAREAVLQAFRRTGLPYAADAVTAVTRELDEYTGSLARGADDACAATRLRGEQSAEALDLRTACYERRWREVEALVEALSRADGDGVQNAAQAARSLTPLDECRDVSALRATTPGPRSPELAGRVDALDERLARATAAYGIGQARTAASLTEALRGEALAVGYFPLVARIDLQRGRAYADLGEGERSIPAFRDAFREALACREERVLRDAARLVAQEYIYASKPAEFDYWADVAQAAIDRDGPDPRGQSFLDHTRCVALWSRGKVFARLECLERHAAKVEPVRPLDEWELTTLGLAAVDVGQFERGIEYARRGYEDALRVNGPDHPRTLEMRMYQCKAQLDYGDLEGALALCTGTLRALEHAAGDNHGLLARSRMYVVDVLVAQGRFDDAQAELERARADGADAGVLEDATARIDLATGHAERSLPHFRKALSEQEELPAEHPDVIGAKTQLGKALLSAGALGEARSVLEDALASCDRAELSPLSRADVEFAMARVLSATSTSLRPRALELARRARETYGTAGPRTRRFDDERAAMDRWLAQPGEPACPVRSGRSR